MNFSSALLYGGGVNIYGFASSNPVARMDPTGLDDLDDMLASGGPMGAMMNMQATMARTAFSVLNMVQSQVVGWTAMHYTGIMLTASLINGAANPDPTVNPFAAAETELMQLSQYALRVGGTTKGLQMLEYQSFTFRESLKRFSGIVGEVGEDVIRGFDAHHMVPRETFASMARLGINPAIFEHPVFGMWLDRAEHGLLHRAGYNEYWNQFLAGLEGSGKTGTEAMEEILRFISNDVAPRMKEFLNH